MRLRIQREPRLEPARRSTVHERATDADGPPWLGESAELDGRSLMDELGLTPSLTSLVGSPADWQRAERESLARLGNHGDFMRLYQRAHRVPLGDVRAARVDLAAPRAATAGTGRRELGSLLAELGPWKKGPFEVNALGSTLRLDAEWRSDLKWQRVEELGVCLAGRRVLDVGTGNGYFLYRILGAGASLSVGLEPTVRYVAQFLALQRLYGQARASMVPLPAEDFPLSGRRFDTVLSMGVLTHRRSPLDHLLRLKTFLLPGGELILETIVVPGKTGDCLVPNGRYAGMRNVFFLPSQGTLLSWLRQCGFEPLVAGPPVTTTSTEQRRTPWADQPSLDDFLAPRESHKDAEGRPTCEGHPRPRRVLVWARVR